MTPEPTRPPARRSVRTAVVACALLTAVGGCSTSVSGDGIPPVDGPHRVPVEGSPGAYHWVALGKDWTTLSGADTNTIGTVRDALGTDGSRVFAVSVTLPSAASETYPPATVTAYDGADGTKRWATTVQWAPGTVPVGGHGVVVFASAERQPNVGGGMDLVALDTASGKERWRRHLADPALTFVDSRDSAPGVFLGPLFYFADGDTVYAVDPATGRVRHRHRMPNVDLLSGPAVGGGRVAVVADPAPDDPTTDREQLVLFGADLRPVSTYAYPDTSTEPNCAQHLVAGADGTLVSWTDRVLCAFQQRGGRLALLWSIPLSAQNPSAPVGGVVPLFDFSQEPDSTVIGLDVHTGRKLWTNHAPDDFNARARIAVVDGTLFSLGHHVQIIDPGTGRTVFDATPRFHGDNVGGDDLPVYASGRIVMYRADGIWAFH